jgi:hypothetical protein
MTDIKAYNPFKQTQRGYHGSTTDFDKFKNDFIGTGEGAQAHGMGHYTAKSKGVANEYRERLTKEKGGGVYPVTYKGKKIDDDTPLGKVIDNIIYEREKNFGLIDLKEAQENYINTLEKDLNATGFLADMKKEWANERLPIAKEINVNDLIQNKGQLYKLSIPKDDVMLREGATFAQQPKKVQNGLENYFKDLVALNKGGYQAGKTLVTPGSEEELLRNYIYNNGDGTSLGIYRGLADRKKTFHELHKDPISSNYAQQQITNDLSDYGIKGISYNGGMDGEANVIFNPDDIEIVRKYYNQPELWDKLKGLRPNEGAELAAIENALRNPQFPMNEQDFNAYEDLGLRYYQNIFQPNTIEIPGYGVASFSRKNRGKDDVTNFRMYPDLFELLTGAKPVNRTNYKNELDRQYDYLENPNNKIYQFLMEDIKDKGKRYKMMRNKETGK